MLDSDMDFLVDIDVDALVDDHNEQEIYAAVKLEASMNRSMQSFLSQSSNLVASTQRLNSSVIVIDDSSVEDVSILEPSHYYPDEIDESEEVLVDSIMEILEDES